MKTVVVGAGINGVVAAIELRKRGNDVVLVDPGPLPHPLAASNDISKVVRAAYGSDKEYTELAERSREIWQQWNVEFGVELYHEVGFLCMRQRPMQAGILNMKVFVCLNEAGIGSSASTPSTCAGIFRHGTLSVTQMVFSISKLVMPKVAVPSPY